MRKCIVCGSTDPKGMVTEKDKGPWCDPCYTEKVRVGYARAVSNFQANHYERISGREARRLAGADSWSV